MTKRMPIVTPVPDQGTCIEGKEYYFVRFDKAALKAGKNPNLTIHQGTAVQCDKCQKWCVQNAVQITDFGPHDITVPVKTLLQNAGELNYDESSESCLCASCQP